MQQRDLAYRFYVTDTLQILCENSAKQSGGKMIKARFCDLLQRRSEKSQDTRTGDEIAADILSRLRGGDCNG